MEFSKPNSSTVKKARTKWHQPKDKPHRPRTGYTIFFQLGRERMLLGTDHWPIQPLDVINLQVGGSREKNAKAVSLYQDGSDQTIHSRVLTGEKVGFADFARNMAAKWKNLDVDIKKLFEEKAERDRIRYWNELEAWNRQQQNKRIQETPKSSVSQGLHPATPQHDSPQSLFDQKQPGYSHMPLDFYPNNSRPPLSVGCAPSPKNDLLSKINLFMEEACTVSEDLHGFAKRGSLNHRLAPPLREIEHQIDYCVANVRRLSSQVHHYYANHYELINDQYSISQRSPMRQANQISTESLRNQYQHVRDVRNVLNCSDFHNDITNSICDGDTKSEQSTKETKHRAPRALICMQTNQNNMLNADSRETVTAMTILSILFLLQSSMQKCLKMELR